MQRPQLCFGQIRHTRLRPALHHFRYKTYFMRLPLRAMTQASHGVMLFSHNRFNLLSFWDKDHGDGKQPLIDWIDTLLRKEGIDNADGEIWLQTFPRVLGYVFNPVSFWFCHGKEGRLRAIVCEVGNTFGERHCYLLDTGADMPYGTELTARKVFHVSPFCAVEGHYRFRFMRTVQTPNGKPVERTVARVDYDTASGAVLLTSISGISFGLSSRIVLKAFFTYPLMTLGVMLKIHWQALLLWRKHVPFFAKPPYPSNELTDEYPSDQYR